VYWIHLAKDRGQWLAVTNTIIKLRVQQKAENFLTSRANVSFSKRAPLHGVSELVS
jgi:hypothetical protein